MHRTYVPIGDWICLATIDEEVSHALGSEWDELHGCFSSDHPTPDNDSQFCRSFDDQFFVISWAVNGMSY